MDKIIYVYPNGEAATMDELHSLALELDLLRETFSGRVAALGAALEAVISEALGVAVAVVERVFNEIRQTWNGFKGIASELRELFGKVKESRKENYRQWQQRNQRRKNHSIMKMYVQNKINKPTDAARFNRARRRL